MRNEEKTHCGFAYPEPAEEAPLREIKAFHFLLPRVKTLKHHTHPKIIPHYPLRKGLNNSSGRFAAVKGVAKD